MLFDVSVNVHTTKLLLYKLSSADNSWLVYSRRMRLMVYEAAGADIMTLL
jgi:hypothetical protein